MTSQPWVNMIVVLDTETTSLPLFAEADHSDVGLWPRMVSMAWGVLQQGPSAPPEHVVMRPAGFKIPESSTKIHGITQEDALERGVALSEAWKRLKKTMGEADPGTIVVCCYNAPFDRGVLLSESLRQGESEMYEFLMACQWQCVMRHATNLLGSGKFLKLVECAKRLGVDTSGAVMHTANDDVTITILVLRKLALMMKT